MQKKSSRQTKLGEKIIRAEAYSRKIKSKAVGWVKIKTWMAIALERSQTKQNPLKCILQQQRNGRNTENRTMRKR